MSEGHGIHASIEVQGEGTVNEQQENAKIGFRFERLFKSLPSFVLKQQVANEVGTLMTSNSNRRFSDLPAGYTYFGQFVDHDITRDDSDELQNGDGPLPDQDLIQARSPSLDLDSVYGNVLDKNLDLFDDKFQFKLSSTKPVLSGTCSTPYLGESLRYDIPRKLTSDSLKGTPLIPDDRNDENLAVSQMHLLWMRFHNHVVNELAISTSEDPTLASKTRELVTCHYQFIVLHDFLRRVLSEAIYQKVIISRASDFIHVVNGEIPAMPLEFSIAAYRFGHSLVREEYKWNKCFSKATFGPISDQLSLFRFTSKGLPKDSQLPTNWIVDWRNFFEMRGMAGVADLPENDPQVAHAIDPFLASGMGNIPGENGMPAFNLASANLRRSGLRGMPSGQDVAQAMGLTALTTTDMIKDLTPELVTALKKYGLDQKTPLWLYILQEANVQQGGNRLGEMGSIILAETFLALAKVSRTSIIHDQWTPDDSPLRLKDGQSITSIPHLIAWIEEREHIVNPLEADGSRFM